MPLIRLAVHDDGTMSATVDGEPLAPPVAEGAWRRGSFARIVDQVTAERMIPARVEVTEADGSTFTDIITATARLVANPEQLGTTVGSVTVNGGFNGWTLAELFVLNRYRRRAL